MNKIIKVVIIAAGLICGGAASAFDGVVGETLKGAGYILFGDQVYHSRCCQHSSCRGHVCQYYNTTVYNMSYVTRRACVTDMYRYGTNVVAQELARQQAEREAMLRAAAAVQVQQSTIVRPVISQPSAESKVSVTQISQPTRVWIPARTEYTTTAEGVTVQVRIPGHYVMSY